MNFQNKLIKMDACNDAVKYCHGYKTLSSAWDVCERGDWMLWLVGKLSGPTESPSRKKLVLCACECARLSLKYVKEGELRPLKAIETAEKWARGEDGKSLQEVKNAASAAAAADAAAAAAYAAYAAYAAADAVAAAAYAYAAYAAIKKEILKACADICRKHYPKAPKL